MSKYTRCRRSSVGGSDDHGAQPFAASIPAAARANTAFRAAYWTGEYLQMTLMCLPVGGEIGVEIHEDTDQLLRVEEGEAFIQMGRAQACLSQRQTLRTGDAVFVPAGTWHNLSNRGRSPLKLSSIYAPPHHPHGTLHCTKADANAAD